MIKPEDQKIYAPYLKAVNEAIDSFIKDNGHKPLLLDAGCGHSSILEEEYKKCEKVIGVDLDKDGLEKNKWVDEKVYADLTEVPLEDNSIDIMVSAWVLEHIEESGVFVKEVMRLLGTGGSFIFIAPNKWAVYSWVTRLIPNNWHGPIVEFFYKRKQEDTFPTFFRLNTEKALDKALLTSGFEKKSFIYSDDVKYAGFWKLTMPLAKLWQHILSPKPMRFIRAHIIGSYRQKDSKKV